MSLLDRQKKLLDRLTSGAAIASNESRHLDGAIAGIDPRLLALEARFSREKRIEKIAGAFPVTFALLAQDRQELLLEFSASCRPTNIGRIENARQFYGFLNARWAGRAPSRPELPDVAGFELACAEARGKAVLAKFGPRPAAWQSLRRATNVVLLKTRFDIRAVLAGELAMPARRKALRLAIAWISGEPRVSELTAGTFDVLAALDDWAALDETLDVDALVNDLASAGLLEFRV